MKKIFLLSNSYLPNIGGLVSYMKNVAATIKANTKHEVEIVTTTSGQKLPKQEKIYDVNVSRINVHGIGKFFYLIYPFYVVFKLNKGLRRIIKNRENYYISRHFYFAYVCSKINPSRSAFLMPLIASKLQKINLDQVNQYRKIYYKAIIPQIEYIEKKILESNIAICVLSQSKKLEIENHFNLTSNRIKVIPPGINMRKFTPLKSIREKEEILNLIGRTKDVNKDIVLTVSRLTSEKNTKLIIESLDKVKDQNIMLYIVGDGPLLNELKKLVSEKDLEENVVFFGNRDDVEIFYKIADLFVLASTYEGFGHVFLEALASGVPCVGLKEDAPKIITASSEIIEHNITGYLINDSTFELTNIIIQYFNDKKKMIAMKERSRKVVEKKFTWDIHIKQVLKMIDQNESM
ncbi:glycosyltransferase family 4 protein [Bacillus sp. N1-1]|uniref:glycosyltransferase family 4 protein n=1 Tax=Bacillus sp. N1-1 TaxID=2682541 RepID=UPI00131726F0|nr:glycosyltransferase family 4 protein [Bacillus sp. N1-1]QHA93677.1 glycosyltransferase [Bacillus sp. N1-1]